MSTPTPATGQQLVTVTLIGIPVALHARSQAHSDELQREFRLLTEQVREEGRVDVPVRLLELVAALRSAYASGTTEQEDAIDAAVAEGRSTLDLTYRLPVHVADAAEALGRLFDEADEFCRNGEHLLTLATPPDVLAYRRWFLREFVRQSAGEPPQPWGA